MQARLTGTARHRTLLPQHPGALATRLLLGALPVLCVAALFVGCGPARKRAVGQWYDPDHGLDIYLRSDGTGIAELQNEEQSARYTISWGKSRGSFLIELYCRQVDDGLAECGDEGYEDFELDCEHIKERVRTENGDNEEMICTGPEGKYHFEAVI